MKIDFRIKNIGVVAEEVVAGNSPIKSFLSSAFLLIFFLFFMVTKIVYANAADLDVSASVVDLTPPIAVITAPDTALVGKDVLFSTSKSTDNEGIVLYQWDFGDNSTITDENIHRAFDTAGTYIIKLSVSDAAGNSNEAQKSIEISNSASAVAETTGGIVETIIAQVKAIGRALSKAVASVISAEPVIKLTSEEQATVQTSTVATASAVGLINILASFSFLNILPYLEYLILKILEFFGIRKRRSPWGVVYNAITKQPISLAIVRIYNTATNQIQETNVTDKIGRFGFLVQPGFYHLVVTTQGYDWPSKFIQADIHEDDIYQNVYHGSDFSIKSQTDLINSDIPMDPKNIGRKVGQNVVRRIRIFVKNEMLAILLIFMLANFVSFVLFKDFITGLGELLFISMVLSELKGHRSRFRWGVVYDSITKLPVSDAVIKLLTLDGSREIHKKTDAFGRYGFLVKPGIFSVQVEKNGYDFPSKLILNKNDKGYSDVYHGEPLKIDKENLIVSANIPIDQLHSTQ